MVPSRPSEHPVAISPGGENVTDRKQALATADAGAILKSIHDSGQARLPLPGGGEAMLEEGDLLVRTTAKPGWAAAEGPRAVVVVAKELTPDLVAEGLVREVVHAVQTRRKALDLEFTDRIELTFATPSADLRAALEAHLDYVSAETLAAAASVSTDGAAGDGGETVEIDGHPLVIGVTPLATSDG